jgi:hypothetical protein
MNDKSIALTDADGTAVILFEGDIQLATEEMTMLFIQYSSWQR